LTVRWLFAISGLSGFHLIRNPDKTMKKLLLIITVATLPVIAVVGADKKAKEKVVPKGKTYVQLNSKNKEIARFKAGQSTAAITDCAQVNCPSTFGKDVVCWVCKERPVSSATKKE
jgi:Na+-transporting NADH:ubiquinone oxidoreductase subunit NqrF